MTQRNWSLPRNLLAESISIMRPHGASGNEGLGLWFGTEHGAGAAVTHIVEVYGSGFQTTPLYMSLSLRAMSLLTDLAEQLDVILIGQIHSHPGRLLELSRLDEEHGIRSLDYLSVVCPYYAQRDLHDFNDCGVHVFEERAYRRLSPGEVTRQLVVNDRPLTKVRCEVPR